MRKKLLFYILIPLLLFIFSPQISAAPLSKVADNETLYNYKEALYSKEPATRLSGRVWSDKTVYSNSKNEVIVDNQSINTDDDFIEVFSALGSNFKIGEISDSPIDLVLTVDCSSSMGRTVDDPVLQEELGRKPLLIDETAQALNQLIDYVMQKDSNNQIAIVAYQQLSKTVFPLGRYTRDGESPYVLVTPKTPEDLSDEDSNTYTITFNGLKDNSPQSVKVSTDPNDEGNFLKKKTNYQAGFNEGLKILAENGTTSRFVNRPKLINVSDGIPVSYCTDNWYDLKDLEEFSNINSDEDREALILQTMLTAGYLKEAVSNHYSAPLEFILLMIKSDQPLDANNQTVLDGLLNKDNCIINGGSSNELLNKVHTDLESLKKGSSVTLDKANEDQSLTVNSLPDNNPYNLSFDDVLDNLSFIDLFEEVPSTEQSEVFHDLVERFNQSEFQPVEDSTANELVYQESIGKYMTVNPIEMRLFGETYPLEKTYEDTLGDNKVEIYAPEVMDDGIIDNPSYSDPLSIDLKEISLIIETSGDKQELRITIPEECLPIVSTEVTYVHNYDDKENIDVAAITDNRKSVDSMPVRFIYGVNLLDSVKTDDDEVILDKISPDYLEDHFDGETVDFLVTEYLNNTDQTGRQTCGEALLTFQPSVKNNYYKAQEEVPIYSDNNLEEPLMGMDELSQNKNYFIERDYFGYKNHQPTLLKDIETLSGREIRNSVDNSTNLKRSSELAIEPGENWIGDLHNYKVTKDDNKTHTADLVYYPVIDGEDNPDSIVKTYLGNNGKVALPVSHEVNISITKYQAIGENSLTQNKLTVSAGDIITYQLSINNLGDTEISDAIITDNIPKGLEIVPNSISDNGTYKDGTITWTLNLAANAQVNVTYKVIVPEVSSGYYSNFFTLTYEDDGKEVTENSNIVEAVQSSPDISLVKYQSRNGMNRTQEKLNVKSDDYLTYFFDVTNNSETDAANVIVKDTVPADLEVDRSSISDNGVLTNNQIVWTIEVLPAYSQRTLSFSVYIPANSLHNSWENTAYVKHDNDPLQHPSNTVFVEKSNINLSIEKFQQNTSLGNQNFTQSILAVNPENLVTYMLKVTNNSMLETAENITVNDSVESDLTIKSVSDNGVVTGNTITWTIPSLDPGMSKSLTFEVAVPAASMTKSWDNMATLQCPDLPETTVKSNTVTIQENPQVPASSNNNNKTETTSYSNSTSTATSNVTKNPVTGMSANHNALIWLISLVCVLLLTNQAYQNFK